MKEIAKKKFARLKSDLQRAEDRIAELQEKVQDARDAGYVG